jgi:hypothetical protein
MAKSTIWRDPIELPWFWRIFLPWFEVASFVWLSIVFVLIPSGSTDLDFKLKVSSVLVGAVTAALAAITRVLENWGTPAKPYVECILGALSREIWRVDADALEGPRERHRITMFRVKNRRSSFRVCRFIWRLIPFRPKLPMSLKNVLKTDCTHKLVPCLRIPVSSKRPSRVFYVNEHYDEYCEGVAGLIYSLGHVATEELPDLHAPNVTDAMYEEYAKLTHDTAQNVKQWLYYSRRIAGVIIYVDGQKWGLLVLDSSDPEAVDNEHLGGKSMRRTLGILTAILEEGLA